MIPSIDTKIVFYIREQMFVKISQQTRNNQKLPQLDKYPQKKCWPKLHLIMRN